ncbi:protoporphyrinogen oxidase [Virgibacillus sp. NKC19-16]|uniref:protoporphyrinogen oxidase n=1 Tax=Virgibacillus salidurans TaxID=2831673 RepID=UPI001F1B5193|nr:protoporphyrinogen oxidase [Virgibacillus sp. NKC19-16]UJL47585.1 protoporphyrinogen oxidase [Virgibacillus sp. NKC19-16]
MARKNIVVVGGGITGLTAAYYLQKEIKEKRLPYDVKLVEASNRLGGKIKTMKRDGFTIEQGPDSLLARKQPAVKLVEELGLQDQIVRNATGQSYILVKNKLHKMPKGTFMGIPKNIRPLLSSNLISAKGKGRALVDLVLPRGKEAADQSLGVFFRRRFGNELLINQIDPLLSGIHSGDIDEMSLKATYPIFYKLEQEYGSVMKGLKKTMPKPDKSKEKNPTGAFFSLENGLETLIDSLAEKLDEDTVTVSNPVDHVEKKDNGYHLLLSNGDVEKADVVIMATPHFTVPRLFSQYDFFKTLDDMPATSTANVVLAFDQSAIKKDIDGTGFLVSKSSNYRITACTWTHKKWPITTPDGKILLRCYVGRPNDQSVVDMTDAELTEIVLKDLKKTMKITSDPEFSVITRWKNARPQYTVGHLERITAVRNQTRKYLPGTFLTGSSYDGVGIPDCIDQGEKTAHEVVEFLRG